MPLRLRLEEASHGHGFLLCGAMTLNGRYGSLPGSYKDARWGSEIRLLAAWQGLACTSEVGMGSLAAAGAFAGACYWLSIYPARTRSCTGRVTTQHLNTFSPILQYSMQLFGHSLNCVSSSPFKACI